MKQAVIFGGAGFIGRHLAAFLRTQNPDCEVHVIDLQADRTDPRQHRIDVRKPFELPFPVLESAIFFNLAAVHKTPGHPDRDYFETNIRGSEHVCACARKYGIRSIVFTSSIAPYGASENLKDEETLPMPNTPYGISKLVGEKIHMVWQAESSDRRLAIVRPGIVFGQGEGGNYTRLYKALNRGLFAYAGRRDTRKAGIYVKDLVRIMELMSRPINTGVQLYNCCFPQAPTIEEIVNTIKQVAGIKRMVPLIPARALKSGAKALGILGSVGLGFHPDRVTKLMVSTNISGEKLHRDYPLKYDLKAALEDWWKDCAGKGLE